jgi:hypothetical protein
LSLVFILGFGVVHTLPFRSQSSKCEFSDSSFENHIVMILTRIKFSRHGAVLQPSACSKDGDTAALVFPGFDDSPKVDFELDGEVLSRLGPSSE